MGKYNDEYDSLDGSVGNEPGMTSVCYFGAKKTFAEIAVPVGPFTTFEQEITIEDDHTFKATHNWKKLVITLDTGEGGSKLGGDRDSRILQPSWKFRLPGLTKANYALQAKSKQDRFLFLFPLPSGIVIQVGTEDLYAELAMEDMSGKNGGGYAGFECTVTSFARSNYIYEGAITLTPAS